MYSQELNLDILPFFLCAFNWEQAFRPNRKFNGWEYANPMNERRWHQSEEEAKTPREKFFHTHIHTSMTHMNKAREKRRKKVISFLDSSSCINIVCCVVKCRLDFLASSFFDGIICFLLLVLSSEWHFMKSPSFSGRSKAHWKQIKNESNKKKLADRVQMRHQMCFVSALQAQHRILHHISLLQIWTEEGNKKNFVDLFLLFLCS